VVYDNYIYIYTHTHTYQDYHVFQIIVFLHQKKHETATTSQNQHVQMHSQAGNITRSLQKHGLLGTYI
jgi:hypothetical protein